jgi:hypothetical protein
MVAVLDADYAWHLNTSILILSMTPVQVIVDIDSDLGKSLCTPFNTVVLVLVMMVTGLVNATHLMRLT